MASSFFPTNFLPQMPTPGEEQDHHAPTSVAPVLLPSTPACTNPHGFQGVANFLGKKRSVSSSSSFQVVEGGEQMNGEDDLSDDCSQVGERKRRLNMEQVKTLEKSFELGNKLEPERKMQLARALGLHPRQIAIWFQNRRARWKTKKLEKDYEVLKKRYEALKSNNEILQAQNKKLQAEIMGMRGRETPESMNLNKETEGSCSNKSENSSDVNQDVPAARHQLRSFFQPVRPESVAQLLHHDSSRSEPPCANAAEHGADQDDTSFCNVFCTALDDQSGFWTSWPEHQSFL